tara:strand:+ start:1801 stop:4221 length:2421 start_codon:yes stop_codon:yes gene_type:complete
MKIDFKKQVLPHLIALFIFALVASAYNSYEWQGKTLNSHDGVSYSGASKEMREYKAKGEEVLWNSRMFSGMPLFQTAYKVNQNLILKLEVLKRVFPGSIKLIFTLMFCFYIALLFYEVDWKVAIVGALGFGLSTWFLLSLEASHNSKINSIAYIAPMLGALYYAYRKKVLLGGVFVALFLSLNISANHFQITYYSIFFIFFIILFQLITSVKNKELPSFFKKSFIILIFAILGVLPNIAHLWVTYDFAKETMRGGQSELTKFEETSSTGLDKDYAMRWSYGKMETFNLLIPGLYAGGYKLDEKSNTAIELVSKGVSKKQAANYAESIPMYYGTQPFTSGPNYLGVIFIFLFVLLFFIEKRLYKWAFLGITIVATFFAWGGNFWLWNEIFFNNMPMFNKFRAPSMWLSMVAISVALGASISLNIIFKKEYDKDEMIKSLKIVGGIFGGILLLFILFGSNMFDFNGSYDENLIKNGFPIDAVIADRMSLLRMDAIRVFVFLAIAFSVVWMYVNDKLKNAKVLLIVVGLLTLVDMWSVGKRYYNEDDFKKVKNRDKLMVKTKADAQILNDKGYYRVFNSTVSSFNDNGTSYYHKSAGGYSPAKLFRYQDVIEQFLSKGVKPVFNMLNTKYFIQGNPGAEVANLNNGALGAAWFVNSIDWAVNSDEEVAKMKSFDPSITAIIDERFKTDDLASYQFAKDVGSKIVLTNFHPDKMTYSSNNSSAGYAVFSEIWYHGNKDWKAYIDGVEIKFERVNYLLRGLKIPKGNHEIVFDFHPKTHYLGSKISLFASIALLLIIVVVLFKELKGSLKK